MEEQVATFFLFIFVLVLYFDAAKYIHPFTHWYKTLHTRIQGGPGMKSSHTSRSRKWKSRIVHLPKWLVFFLCKF